MKKIAILGIAVVALAALIAAPVMAGGSPGGQAGKSNTGFAYLYEKDPTDWTVVEGGAWGKLKYNLSGSTFDYVFNGHKLAPQTEYSLIYYADPWPGNNTGALIATGTTNRGGHINLKGSTDLGFDLPHPDDANYSPPCTCDPCPGAKIWLVLSDDYDDTDTKMVGWNPTEYLFEGMSIKYTYVP